LVQHGLFLFEQDDYKQYRNRDGNESRNGSRSRSIVVLKGIIKLKRSNKRSNKRKSKVLRRKV